jgi:murein tripeptide amidase MpaA
MKSFFFLLLLCTATVCTAQTNSRWLTPYERSGGRKTPRYNETVAFCRALDAASGEVTFTYFGTSPQGRALPLLIVARNETFTPAAARRAGKAVVLIQAGIHAGEIDGKDAGLMLIRDMVIRHQEEHLLDSVIILFVPILNVDGHERFGKYNRINQNGPEEMGWRTTAQNKNLNRDYVKADTPEMRALLQLYTTWLPDLYIDCHVTNGIDFQYDVTYATEMGAQMDPGVGAWIRENYLPRLLPAVEKSGHHIFWYVSPREENDLSRGLQGGASSPRFSTGYAAIHNRPSLLIETHMLKPYRDRVAATFGILHSSLQIIHDEASHLRELEQKADQRMVKLGEEGGEMLPLKYGLGPDSIMTTFLGIRSRREFSDLSGGTRTVYTGEPVELRVPYYGMVTVTDSVAAPLAYIIPREWDFVPPILDVHGLNYFRIEHDQTIPVDTYRFSNVHWRERPFEGRHAVTYNAEPLNEQRVFPAGSVVVPMNQPAARVAAVLFEPRSEDSFVAWGFFDAIFEQKEYAEEFVMEDVGRTMLKRDTLLQRQFAERVAADTAFAHSPSQRLRWLFEQSPWNDHSMNLYPVGRVVDRGVLKQLRAGRQ